MIKIDSDLDKGPDKGFRNHGSFRDPCGHVYESGGRVFRGVGSQKADFVRRLLASDFFKKFEGNLIIDTREISKEEILSSGLDVQTTDHYEIWVEHSRIAFVSYPYEWCFGQLKSAALLHLKLQLEALKAGFKLIDASAYNVQFQGSVPIFIDILSFEDYSEGDQWAGYKQFCESFLAPLLLQSYRNLPFNYWYRGSLEGVDIISAAKLLPWKSYFSFLAVGNIHLHAFSMRRLDATRKATKTRTYKITKHNFKSLLQSLEKGVSKLQSKLGSYWEEYEKINSYNQIALNEKKDLVKKFVQKNKIEKVIDIGCNAGLFSETCLRAGAKFVLGLDIDVGAVESAFNRANIHKKNFTMLIFDIANPTPSQGWKLKERNSLESRLKGFGGVICLALIHHIVIGRNIPLEEFIEWLVSLAPEGLIEFVPKSDPMVKNLLKNREDIFNEYTEEAIVGYLNKHSTVTSQVKLRGSERVIITYGGSS